MQTEATEADLEYMRRSIELAREALASGDHPAGALDLRGATLYTTVEPCYLCSFSIRQLGIGRFVIGRSYPVAGGVSSRYPILLDAAFSCWGPPPLVITGVLLDECDRLFEGR